MTEDDARYQAGEVDAPITPAEIERLYDRSAGEALSDEWQPACVRCLHINGSTTQFCEQCGAPMTQITVHGPLERAYTLGFACHNTVDGQARVSVLVGVWLMFGHVVFVPFAMMGLFGGGASADGTFLPDPLDTAAAGGSVSMGAFASEVVQLLLMIASLFLIVVVLGAKAMILYKATQSWWRHRDQSLGEVDEALSSSA
jgi:hypothetical protein